MRKTLLGIGLMLMMLLEKSNHLMLMKLGISITIKIITMIKLWKRTWKLWISQSSEDQTKQ